MMNCIFFFSSLRIRLDKLSKQTLAFVPRKMFWNLFQTQTFLFTLLESFDAPWNLKFVYKCSKFILDFQQANLHQVSNSIDSINLSNALSLSPAPSPAPWWTISLKALFTHNIFAHNIEIKKYCNKKTFFCQNIVVTFQNLVK